MNLFLHHYEKNKVLQAGAGYGNYSFTDLFANQCTKQPQRFNTAEKCGTVTGKTGCFAKGRYRAPNPKQHPVGAGLSAGAKEKATTESYFIYRIGNGLCGGIYLWHAEESKGEGITFGRWRPLAG
jgi:hypothetical protein